MTTNPIPFLDLVSSHRELEKELTAVFQEAVESGRFIGGPMVESFEREFAEFCGVTECIGVGSGTDALRFALTAAGVRSGDAVITVPNTFIATTEAISQAGALPLFVDVHERTYTLDPEKLREFIEAQCDEDPRTGRPIHRKTGKPVTAIVPVHLYGQMADMDPILALADRHGLFVIEDACQAHGAEYFSRKENRWRKAGSVGRAAAFSFYPGKNLGACGEAGAVTTHDEGLARTVQMLRDHGQVTKYVHEIEGYNGRLDAIQAGILRVKLRRLPEWTESRRRNAKNYADLLKGITEITPPFEPSWSRAVYHLYVIQAPDREGLQKHLAERGIATGLHYPVPLHLQMAYKELGYHPGDFPVSEVVSREFLSLPMYPELTADQQKNIAENIKEKLSGRS